MSIIVETPFQNFTGLDGKPLTNGSVYIGQVGTDPAVPANQIPVFWDEALTIPAAQPLPTSAGYIVRTGSPARVWTGSDYSISVKNSSNVLVYYISQFGAVNFSEYAKLSVLASSTGSSIIGGGTQVVSSIAALRALLKTSPSKNAFVSGYYTSGDGGGGSYWYDSSDTTTADNNGSIIVANDGGRWKLIHNGRVDVRQFGAVAGTNFLTAITNAVNAMYNSGGGEVWVYKTYTCSGTIPMLPMVAIKGPGCGKDAQITFTQNSGIALETRRPSGYAPVLCIGASVSGLSLVGTGITTGGTGISLDNAQQCEVYGNEIALFEIGIYWNKGTTDLSAGLHQSYFNRVSRNNIKPCGRGHYFKGAANRNTIETNSVASCTVGYDFGDALNISETNTFTTENAEGCNSWAEWGAAIYSQTWINLCVENPSSNGFVCSVKDPGRQVFVNLSIIPIGNTAAIDFFQFNGAVPSMRLGSAASSGTNRLGMSVNEDLILYKQIQYAATQNARQSFSGTVAANGRTTIAIPLASSVLNYFATAYSLRSLGGCCMLAYAQNGQVCVDIINPTPSPITIAPVDIGVTVSKFL